MQLWHSFLVVLSLTSRVFAWGDLGHRIVALLAQKYLSSDTQQLLDSILQNDQGYDFSDAAVWADTIKNKRPQTKEWHYIGKCPSFTAMSSSNFRTRCTRLASEEMRSTISQRLQRLRKRRLYYNRDLQSDIPFPRSHHRCRHPPRSTDVHDASHWTHLPTPSC